MTPYFAAAAWLLAFAFSTAPLGALAGPQIGPEDLAQAKVLLDLARAEFTAEQFALLSSRLAQAESACAELTAAVRATQAAAVIAEGGATAASAEAAATTGGRVALGGAAQVLGLLFLVWPSTAHAPPPKAEDPKVRAARTRVEEKLKQLADAARQVEAERQATAKKDEKSRSTQSSAATQSARGITCKLVGAGGGFTAKRPGKCHYTCSNGLMLCKLVRSYGTGCPAGTPALSWFPFSEIQALEDCQ